jgi:hypothetical protein
MILNDIIQYYMMLSHIRVYYIKIYDIRLYIYIIFGFCPAGAAQIYNLRPWALPCRMPASSIEVQHSQDPFRLGGN